jgi:hypothetical protein
MFTDNPTIPAQLETLLDVVELMKDRVLDKDSLRSLIQPKGLPGISEASKQVIAHINAAQDLQLILYDENQNIRPNYPGNKKISSRERIIAAFDRIALGNADTEFWAGRFYAHILISNQDWIESGTEAQGRWIANFNDSLPGNIPKNNPMNQSKYQPLIRWYLYAGMGWIDPAESFIPDPTKRLLRVLPDIFEEHKILEHAEFMSRLALVCPELDGGNLFNEVTVGKYSISDRTCTKAVAIALRNLHDQKILKLSCPSDNLGWSLKLSGDFPISGEVSNRFDSVELIKKK